jgi:hypothetical protein
MGALDYPKGIDKDVVENCRERICPGRRDGLPATWMCEVCRRHGGLWSSPITFEMLDHKDVDLKIDGCIMVKSDLVRIGYVALLGRRHLFDVHRGYDPVMEYEEMSRLWISGLRINDWNISSTQEDGGMWWCNCPINVDFFSTINIMDSFVIIGGSIDIEQAGA